MISHEFFADRFAIKGVAGRDPGLRFPVDSPLGDFHDIALDRRLFFVYPAAGRITVHNPNLEPLWRNVKYPDLIGKNLRPRLMQGVLQAQVGNIAFRERRRFCGLTPQQTSKKDQYTTDH